MEQVKFTHSDGCPFYPRFMDTPSRFYLSLKGNFMKAVDKIWSKEAYGNIKEQFVFKIYIFSSPMFALGNSYHFGCLHF